MAISEHALLAYYEFCRKETYFLGLDSLAITTFL